MLAFRPYLGVVVVAAQLPIAPRNGSSKSSAPAGRHLSLNAPTPQCPSLGFPSCAVSHTLCWVACALLGALPRPSQQEGAARLVFPPQLHRPVLRCSASVARSAALGSKIACPPRACVRENTQGYQAALKTVPKWQCGDVNKQNANRMYVCVCVCAWHCVWRGRGYPCWPALAALMWWFLHSVIAADISRRDIFTSLHLKVHLQPAAGSCSAAFPNRLRC